MSSPPGGAPGGEPASAPVILLRHARSTANNAGVLAGRSAGVDLDPSGVQQAAGLVERLAGCRIARIVSSPLLRCRSTVAPLAAGLGLPVATDDRFAEVDYGDWAGRALKDLAQEPLWRTVQTQPSAATFPNGESLAAVSARAVAGARAYASDGGAMPESGAVLICSHGDVIASILADALGMHLDLFQRLVISPASVSVIRYTPLRTFVERINDTGSLAGIGVPPPAFETATAPHVSANGTAPPGSSDHTIAGDAVVGGDPGAAADTQT